jgi:hypothetical protein
MGALGKALGMQRLLAVNRQFGRLRTLRGTGTLVCFLAFGLRGSFQHTGLDIGTRLLAFEPGNLIAQLLIDLFEFGHSVRQEPYDSQQRFNKRRAFFWRDLGKLDVHASQSTEPIAVQLRQFSAFSGFL